MKFFLDVVIQGEESLLRWVNLPCADWPFYLYPAYADRKPDTADCEPGITEDEPSGDESIYPGRGYGT